MGFAAVVLLGWSWAYASPPGSAAGDRENLAITWCAWGESESCVFADDPAYVQVPLWIAESGCFSGDRDLDARCTYLMSSELTSIPRPSVVENQTLFHATMRAFVGPDPARSIVIMRFVNVVVGALLVALAALVARPVIRRALLLSWAVTLAPVGVFFIASTSPQTWALVGLGTFWAFAVTLLQGGTRPWIGGVAAVGAMVSGGMALIANSDSGFVLGLSVLGAMLFAWPRLSQRIPQGKEQLVKAVITFGGVVMALLLSAVTWFGRMSGPDGVNSLVFPPGDAGRDQPNAVLKAVLEVPTFVAALLGAQPPSWAQRMSPLDVGIPGYTWPGFTYGLGHTEHLLPSLVGVFLVAAIGAVTLSGLMSYSWRKVFALTLVVSGFIALVLFRRAGVAFEFLVDPLLPQEFWPFLFLAVAFALVVYPARRPIWSPTQVVLLILVLSIAQSVALRGTLARYMYGQTHSYTNLSDPLRWWWPSGPEPNVLWLLGSIAGVVFYTSVLVRWNRARVRSQANIAKRISETTGAIR